MAKRRRILCHHCAVVLQKSDREHYVYQCHGCVIREHDLILVRNRDPDHPDIEWLDGGPVLIDAASPTGRATRSG